MYKYLPLREGGFFDDYLLRASTRNSVNDPFDVLPSTSWLTDFLLQMKKYGSGYFDSNENEIRNNLVNNNNHVFKNAGLDELDRIAYISLSETGDNLLMWSHYADSHNGIVIEFDCSHSFFNSIYKSEIWPYAGKLHRIKYRKIRPDKFTSFSEPFMVKSNEWIYEKEHRLLIDCYQADLLLFNKCKKDNYFPDYTVGKDCFEHEFNKELFCITDINYISTQFRFPDIMFMLKVPELAIKSVIFGCSVSDKDFEKIHSKIQLNKNMNHCHIYRNSICHERFELRREKYI